MTGKKQIEDVNLGLLKTQGYIFNLLFCPNPKIFKTKKTAIIPTQSKQIFGIFALTMI